MKSSFIKPASTHSNPQKKTFFEKRPSQPFFRSSQPIQRQTTQTSLPPSAKGSSANSSGNPLPSHLKARTEQLSGFSMDDVKVHYDSDKPASLNAHAFAQANEIHLAKGQEKHLPHEAWHVVQQKQGRVQPTTQLKGVGNINEDKGLEREADEMGKRALQMTAIDNPPIVRQSKSVSASKPIQRRRVVPDLEWEEIKKDKGGLTIYPNKVKTYLRDLTLPKAYEAYDTYKAKGERFKEGKRGAGEHRFKEVAFRAKDKIIRQVIDKYIFLGLIEGETVHLLATRGSLRKGVNGTGKSPFHWRETEIKAAEVQDDDAEYRVEYKNEYSLKDGKLVASYNFGDLDEERYGPFTEGNSYVNEAGDTEYGISAQRANELNLNIQKGTRMSNSEILFYHMKMAKSLADQNIEDFTGPSIIHRHNIVNDDTRFVMLLSDGAYFEKGFPWLKGGGKNKNPDDDYFAALGTPNGQAAAYIAQQHTGEDGNPIDHIEEIERNGTQLKIAIKDVHLGGK